MFIMHLQVLFVVISGVNPFQIQSEPTIVPMVGAALWSQWKLPPRGWDWATLDQSRFDPVAEASNKVTIQDEKKQCDNRWGL